MKAYLTYLFWPHLSGWHYSTPKVQAALIALGCLVLLSFILRFWRNRLTNPVTKKLSASWSAAAFWFGIVGVVLVVSRTEEIQFLSMRGLWIFWGLGLVLYVLFQLLQFRRRHYVLLKRTEVIDERDRYLPRRKG